MPGADVSALTPEAAGVQRLSSTGHWDVALTLPGGGRLHLLAWHAGPPVFDGPEDRNGRRNADEARLWLRYLDGELAEGWGGPPDGPFVLMGDANLDPLDGEGRREAIRALLSDPRLQDPEPRGGPLSGEVADADQRGDPALDTADWPGDPGPGNLRVDYVLPSSDLRVRAAGLDRPGPDAPEGASRHAMVWVEVALP